MAAIHFANIATRCSAFLMLFVAMSLSSHSGHALSPSPSLEAGFLAQRHADAALQGTSRRVQARKGK